WLLASNGTIKTELYQKYAKQMEVELFLPDPKEQEEVHGCIELVKKNDLRGAASMLSKVLFSLQKKRDLPFIAACTEIPLAFKATNLDTDLMISSLEALALKCISIIYNGAS
ncbi:MAG: aspartate racemase, partial [Acetomicrobium sp.]